MIHDLATAGVIIIFKLGLTTCALVSIGVLVEWIVKVWKA